MQPISRLNSTIRAEMARRQINQTALAASLGIPQNQVSARLRGTVEWRVSELLKVADLLDVPASTLLGDAAKAAS